MKFNLQPYMKECNEERWGAVLLYPSLRLLDAPIMVAPSTCIHAKIDTARKRALGISLGAKSAIMNVFAAFYPRVLSHILGGHYVRPLPFEEYVREFDGTKRRLWEERRNLIAKQLRGDTSYLHRSSIFVKDELISACNVFGAPGGERDKQFESAVKGEYPKGVGPPKYAHLICDPGGSQSALWSKSLQRTIDRLSKRKLRHSLKGLTNISKQKVIGRWWKQLKDSYQVGVLIGFDGEEWDSSLSLEVVCTELLCFLGIGLSSKLAPCMFKSLISGIYRLGRRVGSVRLIGKRRSGDGHTSIANGLCNLVCQVLAITHALTGELGYELFESALKNIDEWGKRFIVFCEGDDAIILIGGGWSDVQQERYEAVLSSIGVRPKTELASFASYLSPEFCGLHFVNPAFNTSDPDGVGRTKGVGPEQMTRCGPLPAMKRLVRRAAYSVKVRPSDGVSVGAYARLKAASALALHGHVPLVAAWSEAILAMYPRGRVTFNMYKRDGRGDLTDVDNWGNIIAVLRGKRPKKQPELNSLCARELGISVEALHREMAMMGEIVSGQIRGRIF
jgi:hypothetical protein